MVGVAYEYGSSEIARVSAIDFLTGEILMDRLVQPMKPVTDWKTEFSGITAAMMDVAVTTNVALKGWPAARAELWKYVDAHTILVGHALNHDLSGLGIIHRLVVDSAILIKGPAKNMKWGLKTLCSELLTMDIRRGIVGHDSVEDTFAAREVVLWCINNEGRLKIWEQKKKDERFKAQANRERARNAGRKPSGYNLTEEWNWSLGYNGYNQD
jgi:DNA polymerase III epsilon subunit-like protein